jgi:hypothetical protein
MLRLPPVADFPLDVRHCASFVVQQNHTAGSVWPLGLAEGLRAADDLGGIPVFFLGEGRGTKTGFR